MHENKTPKPKPKPPTKHDNLYQRAGSACWYIRYNVNGRKRRYSLHTTSIREAKRARDQILGDRNASTQLGARPQIRHFRSPTVEAICNRWLEVRRNDGTISPDTWSGYERSLRVWTIPFLGTHRMDALEAEDIEEYLAYLRRSVGIRTAQPLSAGFVWYVYTVLSACMRYARKKRWYRTDNPCELIDRRPARGKSRETILSVDESRAMLSGIESVRLHAKVYLALYTGLRWGEIHGLLWIDIDLDARTLSVERSYDGPVKTEASRATIPLSRHVVAYLRTWQRRQGQHTVVFPSRYNRIATSRSTAEVDAIRDAAEHAGIEKNITPHVFRHTFGTWVYQETRDPKLVQRLMRHANFTTSMGYVHDDRPLFSAVDALPELAGPALSLAR